MQPASNPSSGSRHYQIPWEEQRVLRTNSFIPKSSRPNLSLPLNTPILFNPLKFSRRFKLKDSNGGDSTNFVPLPVVIHRSGKASQYIWDGTRLGLVGFDREPSDKYGSGYGFGRFFQISSLAIQNVFVPQQVQENYMGYLKWKFLHRVFSSALQVLATQAMFRAIGIGSFRSLPSAAALNWVLKDGLGRLSRCIYTASLGSAFDTNLKRVRFSTSILFSLSIGVELLTPAFPQYFLLLATVANVAKSICLAAYIATSSAIHRSFAIADNLGEVSAKAQIQTVCFDNLGLMLAALLNLLCKNNQRFQAGLSFVIYPIFSAVDLFAIYQGLKFVHLQTLTKDRLEIIIDTWIHSGVIPSPAEVSSKEGLNILKKKVRFGTGSKLWPIRIGCVDPKNVSSKVSVLTLQSLGDEDLYFICMETSYRGLTQKQEQGILLCLRKRTSTADIIMGLLQACHIRKTLIQSRSRWEDFIVSSSTEGSMLVEWFKVVEDSKTCTCREINHLIEEIRRAGWAVKNILLNSQEQIRYSMVNED